MVLAHRILGPLLLVSLLLMYHPGLDQGDDLLGLAVVVFGLAMLTGLGGAVRLLLSRGCLDHRFRISPALLVAAWVLWAVRWDMPGSGPLATALERASGIMALAGAILGAWVGWSTPLRH